MMANIWVDGEVIEVPDDEVIPAPIVESWFPLAPLQSVSDRQFFQALAIRGHITEDEALDAVGPGIIPAAMLELIEQIPEDQQFGAKMLIRGATIYERNNALAGLIGSLYGWDGSALDEFWTFAATL